MRSIALFLILSLATAGAQAASGEGPVPPARPVGADLGPTRKVGEVGLGPTRRVGKADLDLNADFDDLDVPPPDAKDGKAAVAPGKPSRAWMFWAAAGTLAAGGLGWIGWNWHQSRNDAVRIVREEQVFTDER